MKRLPLALAPLLCLALTLRADSGVSPLLARCSLPRDVGWGWVVVTEVVDGDTVWVDLDSDGARDAKLRYIGIDTPEISDGEGCYGPEAKERNRQLVEGQRVRLEKDVSETDRHGRLLRYVYLTDGAFVNGVLVREGYARAVDYPPDLRHTSLLASLQQQAKTANAGGWAACGW